MRKGCRLTHTLPRDTGAMKTDHKRRCHPRTVLAAMHGHEGQIALFRERRLELLWKNFIQIKVSDSVAEGPPNVSQNSYSDRPYVANSSVSDTPYSVSSRSAQNP